MPDPLFSGEHRERFRELLTVGELYALNSHDAKLDSGPWNVSSDITDPETAFRLKARFRSAVRKAAFSAGAPYRCNRMDWWISRLVRGKRLPFVQGLIQRSAEYCEELEANSLELGLPREKSTEGGIYRDRYPCEWGDPYFLYDKPHETLSDPDAEFQFWWEHIWEGFKGGIADLGQTRYPRKRQDKETREAYRDRVRLRTENLYAWMRRLIRGLSYDLAVLQANYSIDRGLRGATALDTFNDESAPLLDRVRTFWREGSRRLGLSYKKQEKEISDLAGPFREVGEALRQLTASADPFEGWAPVPRADWRDDAEFANECPPFLQPAKAVRLAAIGKLKKDAASALMHSRPQTGEELEQCLLPIFSEYVTNVFDEMSAAKLSGGLERSEDYGIWLRSKCAPAVVDDVCRPIFGHFVITLRYIAEIIGEVYRPEKLATMRRLLFRTIADGLLPFPGSPTLRLEKRLLGALLEERTPFWDSKFLVASAEGARSSAAAEFQEDPNALPLGDNPFPPEHPAHEVFDTASWEAKQEIGELQKQFLVLPNGPAELLQSIFRYRAGHFNIIAKKGTCVVGDGGTGRGYEAWLDDCAKFWLEDTLSRVKLKDPARDPAAPPFFGPEDLASFENNFTLELIRIVKHYKQEAASMVLLAKAGHAKAEAAKRASPAARRNQRYLTIDRELRAIAESRPTTHQAVFEMLTGRTVHPPAEPFKSAGGWMPGFKKDPARARIWLSKSWTRLKLPAFARGPK